MHPEPASQGDHADALCAGCSHGVHFLVREPCSRSFGWFRRRADQRVVGLPGEAGLVADALIPRGNQPLNPGSPVPAMLHCVHPVALIRIAADACGAVREGGLSRLRACLGR